MSRLGIFGYQLLTGISDFSTGAMLIIAPALTLRLMHLDAPPITLVYVSFIGAFVLSVGLACLYGALLAYRKVGRTKLEVVWLLTAFTRAAVAVFIVAQVMGNALEAGWAMVAIFDGVCVVIQAMGLRKGWLACVAR